MLALIPTLGVLGLMAHWPAIPAFWALGRSGAFLASLAILSLVVAFTYQESTNSKGNAMTGGSMFPVSMLILPVRTRDLVLWPVLYAAATLLSLWVVFAGLVLRPQGVSVDLLWPGLALLGFTTTIQASVWGKFTVAAINLVWSLGGMAMVSVLSVVAGLHVLAPWQADLAFGLLIAFNAGLSFWGLERARRGAEYWRVRQKTTISVTVPKAPFRSGLRAQLWLEIRRNGAFLPGFVLLTCVVLGLVVCFSAPGEPVGLLDGRVESTIKRLLFLAAAPLCLMAAAAMGTSPSKSDTFTPSLSLQPFFATRPLSTVGLALAKFGSLFVSSLAATVVLAASFGLWLLMPATLDGRATTMGAALAPFLGGHAVVWASLGFLVFVIAVWKSAAANACMEATGRRWPSVVLSTTGGIGVILLPLALLQVQADPQVVSKWLGYLPAVVWSVLAVKWMVAAVGLFLLRGGRFGWGVLIVWSLVVAVLTVALRALTPFEAGPILAGVVLFLPLNRVVWMPLALGWNRHR